MVVYHILVAIGYSVAYERQQKLILEQIYQSKGYSDKTTGFVPCLLSPLKNKSSSSLVDSTWSAVVWTALSSVDTEDPVLLMVPSNFLFKLLAEVK